MCSDTLSCYVAMDDEASAVSNGSVKSSKGIGSDEAECD